MNCVICGGPLVSFLSLYDDRYGYNAEFNLRRCRHCQHRQLDADFSPAAIGDLYSTYYPRSEIDVDALRAPRSSASFGGWLNGEQSEAFRWVPNGCRVLDIGCGAGESIAYFRSRGCEAYGVEADRNVRRVRDRYGFNIQIGTFDPARYEDDFFDYITLAQVVEHAPDPVSMLRGAWRVLKRHGQAIITTPNASGWGAQVFRNRWINWHVPYHLHFFSRESFSLVAQRAGFAVESCRTVTSSEWLNFQWRHLATFPRRGEPSVFWSPRASRRPARTVAGTVAGLAHRSKVNHLLTRLFDALDCGDNFVFVLRKEA